MDGIKNPSDPQVETEEQKGELGFSEQLSLLPPILQKRFFKQLGLAILLAMVCIVMMVYFKTWGFALGLLISLYLTYMALDIVWRFASGKIERKVMVVLKANNLLKQERVLVSLRELNGEGDKTGSVYRLFLTGNKHDLAMIASNVVVDVYIDPRNVTEVIAWEITDFLS